MCFAMLPRVALLVLCSLIISACGGDQNAQGPGGDGGRGAFPPTDVQTVVLEPKPIAQTSEFVATIRSLRSTTVQPQVEGIIRQVMIRSGDRVTAGQPLLQIDPERQEATNTVTESQRASREADLAFRSEERRVGKECRSRCAP